MTLYDFWEFFLFTLSLLILTIALGKYMRVVFTGKRNPITAYLSWLEQLCYRTASINPSVEMDSLTYIKNLLIFNLLGFLAIFLLMITQFYLPLNPENFSGTSLHLSFNTAVSFMTNTNWQSYAGEKTLSYLTQMLGLNVQNFLSSATGLAVLVALIRGVTRKQMSTIGNFWQDLVRSIVYIFLPLSLILACLLVSQGVIQNFSPYTHVITLEGANQTIPLGPVASQVAIKQLGTNGGGFFNANGAHPFENPSAFSNLIETLCIIIIPSASIYFYGLMLGTKKHIWVLYSVIFFFFAIGFVLSIYGEHLYSLSTESYPVLEGKETRFGMKKSILWAVLTTATSNGSVNAMMSSLSPIAGGVALFNMMLEELIFGGVGVGLCSLLKFTLLTVFISGLMVGRTPEYMGKKIEVHEMKWIAIAILTPAALILIGSGISSVLPVATKGLETLGPHGLTTILYAFTSAAANNGSAFSGLNADTAYYNLFLGVIMLFGRLSILIPSLMIAGLLAKKKVSPPSLGTFSTNSLCFGLLLFSVILIISALTFFPAIALGPFVEQLLMMENRFF